MNILVLVLIGILCFGITTLCRKWRDKDVLILVAIGCAINSNIYNSGTMPIALGNIVFGIDSILYTLFMFTVIIMAKDYSIKEAKNMALTTIAAIMISAFIQFFAYWSFSGFESGIINTLVSFTISSIGTFFAVWAMLWAFEKLQKRNINTYINFAIGIFIASIINSFIYFGGMALFQGQIGSNFAGSLIGSYIGKFTCIILGLLCYWINVKIWVPNGLERKKENVINNQIELDLTKNK